MSPSTEGSHDELAVRRDPGYTLIELLLVVVVLGILATVVVFAVGGVRTDAADTSCSADHRLLATAYEAYTAQHVDGVLTASGTDNDRYERTLVEAGFLREVSTYNDLGADGAVTPEAGASC